MGIDYILNYNCPIKEKFGHEETFNLIKAKAQFEFLQQMMEQPGNEKINLFTTIRYQVLTNGQFQEKKATLKDLDKYLEEFRFSSYYCNDCQANLIGCSGGCWGYITYPIKPFVESFFIWIAEYIINNSLNKPSGMLINYIVEHQLKPDLISEKRKDGMFELDKPLEYKKGGFFSKTKVNTDQIFEMLFGFAIDAGSAMVIFSFLSYCKNVFPDWLDSFTDIVMKKNPELTAKGISREIAETMNVFFQYGDYCRYALNTKNSIIVIP